MVSAIHSFLLVLVVWDGGQQKKPSCIYQNFLCSNSQRTRGRLPLV